MRRLKPYRMRHDKFSFPSCTAFRNALAIPVHHPHPSHLSPLKFLFNRSTSASVNPHHSFTYPSAPPKSFSNISIVASIFSFRLLTIGLVLESLLHKEIPTVAFHTPTTTLLLARPKASGISVFLSITTR